MSDLIDRETAIQVACDAVELFPSEWAAIATEMNRIPAIDAELVRHGRWISSPVIIWEPYQCSICEKYSNVTHKYCPNCGAKMDLEE